MLRVDKQRTHVFCYGCKGEDSNEEIVITTEYATKVVTLCVKCRKRVATALTIGDE